MHFDFLVDPTGWPGPSASDRHLVRLRNNTWNDYGFGTTFYLDLRQGDEWEPVGVTKIGQAGMVAGYVGRSEIETSSVDLRPRFSELRDDHFSLGQDAGYYEGLVKVLGSAGARDLLMALRDFVAMPSLLERYQEEAVVRDSLMRSVSAKTIREQYGRILAGDLDKRDFSLTYKLDPHKSQSHEMTFSVDRASLLPTNVHVLIGANGTGKTTALSQMRWAFEDARLPRPAFISAAEREQFAALVSVSFSAFDTFPVRHRSQREQQEFRITNVRLPETSTDNHDARVNADNILRSRNLRMTEHISEEVLECLAERGDRLLPLLRLLADADSVLEAHRISDAEALRALDYSALSAGHKIALLTMASLVRYCEEKTLVLLDEPESHLHPPLLGAMTRGISALMTQINGLAIVATHSPVILQEVPRRCAWIMWNSGGATDVAQPSIETFGANLGMLTREVFDLEIGRSGYHALLQQVADGSDSYEEAIHKLDQEVGDEARLILRSMIRRKPLDT